METPVRDLKVFPTGSRFRPTDLGLVRRYLRDMVDKNESGFITTLDVYSHDPWLLDHVHNDLFKRKEYYYFSPSYKRDDNTSNRTVLGRGESEGGTWKSNGEKKAIKDRSNKVEGYMQSFVYKKNVKGNIEITNWLMTEYCLPSEIDNDLVLCHIQDKTRTKSNQLQDEESLHA